MEAAYIKYAYGYNTDGFVFCLLYINIYSRLFRY